ncbi:MAG: hypothetical protein ACI93R_001183 [Flavobacteriales bacterium]|jgi:hypothetical protein
MILLHRDSLGVVKFTLLFRRALNLHTLLFHSYSTLIPLSILIPILVQSPHLAFTKVIRADVFQFAKKKGGFDDELVFFRLKPYKKLRLISIINLCFMC